MDSNEETVQRQVIVNAPGQRSEVLTERTQRRPGDSGLSTATVAIIAILAVTVISAILYTVSNTSNESAKRNANLEVSSQAPPTTIVQQPAQQAPVIILQPAQQAPVIQQPSLIDNARDDANIQEVATNGLGEDMAMDAVSLTVTDGRAILTGTVYSQTTRVKAERIVKAVRGVKSVDNQIVVSG